MNFKTMLYGLCPLKFDCSGRENYVCSSSVESYYRPCEIITLRLRIVRKPLSLV